MTDQSVAARLDGRTVAELDREAEARGISRSEALRRAVERWVRESREEDEERLTRSQANHRQLMNRLDYIVGMIREQDRMAGHLEEYESRRRQTHERRASPDGEPELQPEPAREPQPRLEPEEDAPEPEEPEGSPRQGALAEARKRARRRFD